MKMLHLMVMVLHGLLDDGLLFSNVVSYKQKHKQTEAQTEDGDDMLNMGK